MLNRAPVKETILLLVSDPVVRAVMAETLEGEGYMVLSAHDLGQAVERLGRSSPDLLITRSYVQGLPGHEAAKYLRTKNKKIRVLMVGGMLDDDRLRHRVDIEGFEVFPKPYTAAELLEKVREVLAKPRG